MNRSRIDNMLNQLARLTRDMGGSPSASELASAVETLKRANEEAVSQWTLANVARFERPFTPLEARDHERDVRAQELGEDRGPSGDYYDRTGAPLSFAQWCAIRKSLRYLRIAGTVVGEAYYVSTVWLGMDHAWGDGPPILFESMIFALDDAPGEINGTDVTLEQWRYHTEMEALQGHRAVVLWLRALARGEK